MKKDTWSLRSWKQCNQYVMMRSLKGSLL